MSRRLRAGKIVGRAWGEGEAPAEPPCPVRPEPRPPRWGHHSSWCILRHPRTLAHLPCSFRRELIQFRVATAWRGPDGPEDDRARLSAWPLGGGTAEGEGSLGDGMNILMAASEAVPFAKTGGLADVAGALPRAVADLGHRICLFLPNYPSVRASGVPIYETA